LVASTCRPYFSSTLEGFKILLLHPTSMWSCNKWQIDLNDAYYYFSLGFRCATRTFQAYHEI
jgi:hypothetical protein